MFRFNAVVLLIMLLLLLCPPKSMAVAPQAVYSKPTASIEAQITATPLANKQATLLIRIK